MNRPKPIGSRIEVYSERATGLVYEVSHEGYCYRRQKAVGSPEWTDWEWCSDASEELRGKPS